MTELKTIKDFIVETDIGNVISPFEIKQEAINWIKAVSKEDWDCGTTNCDKKTHSAYKEGIIFAFQTFFGITDIDLEEK